MHTRFVDPSPSRPCAIRRGAGCEEWGVGLHVIDGQVAGMVCDGCWYVLKSHSFDACELRDAARAAEARGR